MNDDTINGIPRVDPRPPRQQVATFCRVVLFDKAGSGCRTQSRKFARWMIEPPRSRPSWTPSASERPYFSV